MTTATADADGCYNALVSAMIRTSTRTRMMTQMAMYIIFYNIINNDIIIIIDVIAIIQEVTNLSLPLICLSAYMSCLLLCCIQLHSVSFGTHPVTFVYFTSDYSLCKMQTSSVKISISD